MRIAHLFLLVLCIPAALLTACRDGGLGIPADGQPPGADMGPPPSGNPCAAYTTAPACRADTRCEAATCPGCDATGESFLGCYDRGTAPAPICPAIDCAKACEVMSDQASCDAAPGCTTLYKDPGTCLCNSPGCCMVFARCVETPVQCSESQGDCAEAPSSPCGGGYALAFDGPCQIGCVAAAACLQR